MRYRRTWQFAVVALTCATRLAFAQEAAPPPAQQDPLAKLLNYPFVTTRDLAQAHKTALITCEVIRAGGRTVDGDTIPQALLPLFERLAAFTNPDLDGTQKLYIEPFATSQDKAIVHLRERCKLAPPRGGAVVRLYASRADMPEPIRDLSTETVAGLNYCSRFVAVWVEDKSPQELQDTISHELCHAYINSILGPEDEDKLPPWFHEGVALWLSDCRDLYVSYVNAQTQKYTYSTADYNEYRTIFRYIAKEQGEAIADALIRQAVETRDVEKLVPGILGLEDYKALRKVARGWRGKVEWLRPEFWRFAGIALAALFVWRMIGFFAWLERYRRYGRRPRPVDYEEAEELDPAVVAGLEAEDEEDEEALHALMLATLILQRGGRANIEVARGLVDEVTQQGVLSAEVRDVIARLNARIWEMERQLADEE